MTVKKTTPEERRRVIREITAPGSPTRQIADWGRTGPENPPPVVRNAVERMRRIDKETREQHWKIISKHSDD